MPSRQEIEDYLNALDEWVSHSFHAATADIPSLNAIANRVWADLSRFGSPNIPLPGLGIFDVPPPPPPPPAVDPTWLEKIGGWIAGNRWKAFGFGLSIVIGSGLLAGYVSARVRTARLRSARKRVGIVDRKEVAVVLGADCLLGIPLVLELESRGFIVIATVVDQDSVKVVEDAGHGYVRGLVLDPSDPSSVPAFLRALQTTLSIRFPTTATGDPYYPSPSLIPHVHTLISLLSIHSPPAPIPLEHLSMDTDYLSHLQKSHIAPLQVVQGLLPLMRNGNGNNGGSRLPGGKKTIIICLPVIASRVGVAWASASAMSAGATIKAIDVLRRELRESGQADRISVTIADVGSVGRSNSPATSYDTGAAAYMNDWSSNLRATYGPAFLGALEHSRVHPRIPEDVETVVRKLAGLVYTPAADSFGISSWFDRERVGIGAGATTYALASRLPTQVLDFILSIPGSLIRMRNSVVDSTTTLAAEEKAPVEEGAATEVTGNYNKPPPSSVDSSDADQDSTNVSESERVGSSWVSLDSRADE